MKKLIIPKITVYKEYLRKYGQYSPTESWIEWYSKVIQLKGKRVAKTLLSYKSKSAKLLDLGCSIGFSLSIVGQYFPDSTGCDVEASIVIVAKKFMKNQNLKIPVILFDGKRLPFPDNSFDIVTNIEVIEHVEKPKLMLKEIRRVLKPDGILHITTANKWWPIEPHFKLPFLSFLPTNLADKYVRLAGLGLSYQGIRLPSYGEFYKMVNQYFKVDDITLDVIANYDKYDFGKERGLKVIFIGSVLKRFRSLAKINFLSPLVDFFESILVRISLGWLFIAHPRK